MNPDKICYGCFQEKGEGSICPHCGFDAQATQPYLALPLGTNTDYRPGGGANVMDAQLWARNKWLIAHADSDEARQGAVVGLRGVNIDVQNDL